MWMWMETLRCKTGTLKHVETGTSDGRAAFTVRWVEILVTMCESIWGSNVTANTRGGFTRNSAPLWARGQDAFLVIRGTWDRSRPTQYLHVKLIWVPFWLKGNPLQWWPLCYSKNIPGFHEISAPLWSERSRRFSRNLGAARLSHLACNCLKALETFTPLPLNSLKI